MIPEATIEKPPSAELRPDQKDTDSLPPYDVLDVILEDYVEDCKAPEEIAAAHSFDPNLVQVEVPVSDPARVRAYALSSPTMYVAFLHAYTDHTNPTTGVTLTIDTRAAGTATWIEPATGRVLGSQPVTVGRQTLTVPAFVIDAALKVVR